MRCIKCDSGNVESIRKLIEGLDGISFYWMVIEIAKSSIEIAKQSLADSVKPNQRVYDLFECRDCGFTMMIRRFKELQEITSKDVGKVSDIL